MYSKIYLRLEPLGLELVAAAARRAGHSVRLIDLQCEPHQNFFRLLKHWQPDVIAFSVITSLTFLKSSISLALRVHYCRKHSFVLADTVFRLFPKKFCGTPQALWIAC